MPKIAISYRRTDSNQIAGRIRDRLAAQYGNDSIFIDIYDLPLGTKFPEHIQKVWSEASVLIALIGPNWLRSGEHRWPALALRYLAFPAFLLLVVHYVIVNVLDLDIIYLRVVSFLAPLLFGAAFYWETRTKPIAAFAVGVILGVVAVSAMIVSVSLRYHQPIMPASTFEWLENVEYVVSITLGFSTGNMCARLPSISSWLREREDWVRFEVEAALRKGIPIIPVLVDGATMPTSEQLPKSMREITYRAAAQVHSGADFDSQMTRLIAGINKILADKVRPTKAGQETS